MIVRVSDDGRITIPARARQKLGIKPGSVLSLDVGDDEIKIRPIKSVADVAGIFSDSAEGNTTDWETAREQAMLAVARQVEAETGH